MSKHVLSISCKGATKFQRCNQISKYLTAKKYQCSKLDAANIVAFNPNKNCDLMAATKVATIFAT